MDTKIILVLILNYTRVFSVRLGIPVAPTALQQRNILNQILNNTVYDNMACPPGIDDSSPASISVSIRVRSVENLNDHKMEFTVQINYRQEWTDPRVRYDHLINKNIRYLQLTSTKRIWTPDIIFDNEKTGAQHDLMMPNSLLKIYSNGKVRTSSRITLLLNCQMDLHYYPMDKQACEISMGSYAWGVEDLLVRWRNYTPVEVKSGIKMPRFRFISFSHQTCPAQNTSTASFDCIKLVLNFEREFGYYLVQVYVPCIMLVIVSWVSFFLEPMAAEARISLCVTTILAVVTQAYGITQNVPPASYIKAIDVWIFAVQLMVFAAILQFSIVNYVARFQWRRTLRNMYVPPCDMEDTIEHLRLEGEKKAKRIDLVSKILFLIFFGVFNVFYWYKYVLYQGMESSHPNTVIYNM